MPGKISQLRPLGRDDILETQVWRMPRTDSPDPHDRVFVLIHGLGLSHCTYGRLATQLARHGTVVAVDLPGFGKMRRPASAVSVRELAECVGQALTDAKVESAVVIGHSMGAQIALELALISPSRVDALVLIGPVVNPRRRSLLQQGIALAHDSALEPWATKVRVFREYLSCGALWFLTEAREMVRYRTDLDVLQLETPLLVLRGEKDVIAPEGWCDWLALHGVAGRSESIPGHRHVVIHTEPRRTADLVANFASGLDAHSDR